MKCVFRIIRAGGEDKLLFGTDSPIAGADTYGDHLYYTAYWTDFRSKVTDEQYEKLMHGNAERLFGCKDI